MTLAHTLPMPRYAILISMSGAPTMAKARSRRKVRKTFSLSRQAVTYLESLRKETKGESMSSVLEDIIRAQQEAKEVERISASFTRYYDSLTPEQQAEDRAWGQFAETQFSTEQ
jgi:hypothetical protein